MEEHRKDGTIYYQERKHHREQLRGQIDPSTIDRLQVNPNPSQVSRKAYQSLYQNQLQSETNYRKTIGKYRVNTQDNETLINKSQKSNSVFMNAAAKLCDNSTKFRDYYQQKDTKVRDHIEVNYDGGSGFFRQSDNYNNNKRRIAEETKSTLKNQLDQKNWMNYQNKNLKELENKSYQQKCQMQRDRQLMERENNIRMKENQRHEQQKLIQEEKAKRTRNSIFNYNNVSRHNPITNPIEYHIDNPYILKGIQEKTNNRMSNY